jgi:hypothetical protein
MTYDEAVQSVQGYLQYDTASADIKARLDVAVPRALNNARLWAERKHNWAYSHVKTWLVLDANGDGSFLHGYSSLALAQAGGDPSVRVKSATAAARYNTSDGTYTKLMIRPLGAVQRLELQQEDLKAYDLEAPPVTADSFYRGPYITVEGEQISIVEPEACIVMVHGYVWQSNYITDGVEVAGTFEDFFLKYVPDVLIWKAVIDCNYIASIFVNRQDGNVGVPLPMLQDAWDSAMEWDHYQHQYGINYQLG